MNKSHLPNKLPDHDQILTQVLMLAIAHSNQAACLHNASLLRALRCAWNIFLMLRYSQVQQLAMASLLQIGQVGAVG
jgi:hypothetical protein